MKDSLSPQDLILISSYIDDRLAPDQKAKVEARAEKDPLFRSTIAEMAYARRMLRSLPLKRAPHNFTLPQSYARQPRRFSFQPAFAFASVVATAVTIIILAGSLFFPRFIGSNAAAPSSAAPMAALGATDSARSSSELAPTAVPPLILWNGVPYNGAGGYGLGGGGGADPCLEGTGACGIGGGAPNTYPLGGAGGSGLPTPTPLPTEVPGASSLLATQPQATPNSSDLILGIAPKDEQGQEVPAPSTFKSAEAPLAPAARPLTTLNILEIAFGSVAVITGALALFLRRRS